MKSITITQLEDGTFTVEAENEMPEMEVAPESPEGSAMDMQEDTQEGEAESTYQTLEEALDAVAQMFGKSTTEQEPMMEGEADFLAGFKGARGEY